MTNSMRFLPLEKRVGKHSIVFETDIPYKEFCFGNMVKSMTKPI